MTQTYFKSHRYYFIGAAIILTLLATSIAVATRSQAEASPQPAAAPATSAFSFNAAKAPGWRQGPSNQISMALFSSSKPDGTSTCFTSAELKKGQVDEAAELQKTLKENGVGGNSLASIATVSSTFNTKEGKKAYTLHHYRIDTPHPDTMKGLAIGYIQLGNGYVEVESHCNAAEDLASTVPALQAYVLNKL